MWFASLSIGLSASPAVNEMNRLFTLKFRREDGRPSLFLSMRNSSYGSEVYLMMLCHRHYLIQWCAYAICSLLCAVVKLTIQQLQLVKTADGLSYIIVTQKTFLRIMLEDLLSVKLSQRLSLTMQMHLLHSGVQ